MKEKQKAIDEIERGLIGALLKEPEAINRVIEEGITENNFSNNAYREIFSSMKKLESEKKYYGELSLIAALPTHAGLVSKIKNEKHRTAFGFYSETLHKVKTRSAIVRGLLSMARDVSNLELDQEFDVKKSIDDMIAQIKKEDYHSTKSLTPEQGVASYEAMIAEKHKGNYGYTTSMKKIDRYLNGGLQDGQLIVIGARPGHGKTTLALQVAIEAAKENFCYFVSVEMDEADLTANALAYIAEVDSRAIRNGVFDLHVEKVEKAKESFKKLEMNFLVREMNFETIESEIRKAIKKKSAKIIIVDYLQMLKWPALKQRNRLEELSAISNRLKQLALEYRVCIVATAQLNREIEGRPNAIARLADIKGCGDIEQDADVIIFIQKEAQAEKSSVILNIAKNRRGLTGIFKEVYGDYTTGRIREV